MPENQNGAQSFCAQASTAAAGQSGGDGGTSGMACPAGKVSAQGECMHNERAKNAAQTLGDWWDAHRAEGDVSHGTEGAPVLEPQLALQPRDRVLDLACGNGA